MFVAVSAVFACVVAVSTAAVTNKGFYPFNEPNWNYDFGQTADTCPTTCSYESTNDPSAAPCGPACWDKPSAAAVGANNQCGGQSQTPIDLSQVDVDHDLSYPILNSNGGCDKWTQFANDHAFEVKFTMNTDASYDCANMQATYNGIVYTLHQFHFHAPSEHTIGGGEFDAELHMVHLSANSDILVLGVFLQAMDDSTIADNTYLKPHWEVSDSYGNNTTTKYSEYYGVSGTTIDAYALLPASREYYTYSGSLTTVPCTEGLTWIVFAEPVAIGATDLANLITSVKEYPDTITLEQYKWNDGRPTQPLNGRTVLKYSPAASEESDDDTVKKSNASLGVSIVALFVAAVVLAVVIWMCLNKKNAAEQQGFELKPQTTDEERA